MVWDNLARHIEDIDVLCIYHEALRMIAKAVEGTRNPATRACLFYCIQNLVYIIRVCIFFTFYARIRFTNLLLYSVCGLLLNEEYSFVIPCLREGCADISSECATNVRCTRAVTVMVWCAAHVRGIILVIYLSCNG